MPDYELVKNRIENRNKKIPLTMDEARRLFYDTTVSIIEDADNHMYGWFAIMSECRYCSSINDAINDALEYLKKGGY